MTNAPVLDVVIPVYNEQHTVAAAARRLDAHLRATFPYPFRITIADNASTDDTWQVAQSLAGEVESVVAIRLGEKGRGRALRQVWLDSDASILAYTDVDLSTDLDALWPLIAPLMSGHSDLAIGTRLHRNSRVIRGPKREFISRGYNLLLRVGLGAGFSDAQCGFKAIRADVARQLLPLVADDQWFFDTELLVLAERCGLRIHEVPVDWWDDPDSRVDIGQTVRDDLRGIWRMHRTRGSGDLPVTAIRESMGRTMPAGSPRPDPGAGTQGARFLVVGAASTVLHLGLFALLLAIGMGDQIGNLVALLVATIANTATNRAWTFGVRGRAGAWRHQVQGLVIFAVTWAMTAAALGIVAMAWPSAPIGARTAVVAVATVASTLVKFVAMRHWMFIAPGADTASPSRASAGEDLQAEVDRAGHDRGAEQPRDHRLAQHDLANR